MFTVRIVQMPEVSLLFVGLWVAFVVEVVGLDPQVYGNAVRKQLSHLFDVSNNGNCLSKLWL